MPTTAHDLLSAYLAGWRGNETDGPNEGAAGLIEALGLHGFVIVPREPTPEMEEAGWEADEWAPTPLNAAAVYRAMIDAALKGA
jgi:hypothetical protein